MTATSPPSTPTGAAPVAAASAGAGLADGGARRSGAPAAGGRPARPGCHGEGAGLRPGGPGGHGGEPAGGRRAGQPRWGHRGRRAAPAATAGRSSSPTSRTPPGPPAPRRSGSSAGRWRRRRSPAASGGGPGGAAPHRGSPDRPPADAPWRTVSVAAATCADANAASTAAVVAGDQAEAWLADARVPARLVSRDGEVRYLGGWPESDGGPLVIPSHGHVYGGAVGPRSVRPGFG